MSYDDKQALLKAYSEESKKALEKIEFGHTYDGKITQKLKEIDLSFLDDVPDDINSAEDFEKNIAALKKYQELLEEAEKENNTNAE